MVEKAYVLKAHEKTHGKIEVMSKVKVSSVEDLATYYTPGVAYVCEAIKSDKEKVFDYTNKANMIAIVSDGTRILGLGNIGPEAGLPVMEGKAILFKKFGGVDAIPLCISTTDEDEIVSFVKHIAPTFGAINIEDIESPKCFRIVDRLSAELDIPIFHDDQYGTAIVVLAGLINSAKLAGKRLTDMKVVINGSGAAGAGITKLLHQAGLKKLYVLDSAGLIYAGREAHMNALKEELASFTNPEKLDGGLDVVVRNADALIGASKPGAFTKELISSMAEKKVVFALANPIPEISYEDAKNAGAYIAATGRSDKPNQVNNLLAFPAVMRGLLEARPKKLTQGLLLAAAKALAKSTGKNLSIEHILPNMLDKKESLNIASTVAAAVAEEAMKEGIARVNANPKEIKQNTKQMLKNYAKFEKRVVE